MVQPDSFEFAGVDVLTAYGIRCISHDALFPRLRARQVIVPERDGAHDFGARYYDERLITLDCDSMRGLSRQELREAAALLTRKGKLVLWDEPDKYYIGRVYRQEELTYIGMAGHEFRLTFTCEPFAYGRTVAEALSITGGAGTAGATVNYKGTAKTPTRLQITNVGASAIPMLRIRIRERSE